MKIAKRILLVLGGLLVVLSLLPTLLGFLFSGRAEASSIGIIGGADGPTAIFVTSTPSPFPWLWVGLGLCAAGLILHFVGKSKQNKPK